MKVISKRQGRDVVLTIPATFHVMPGTRFTPRQLPDGTLQFTPVRNEFSPIWEDDTEQVKKFNQSIGSYDEGVAQGRERADGTLSAEN